METDREQLAVIDHFVRQATALDAAASLANLVLEATTHPSLFAFSEILSDANLSKLQGTPYSSYLDVLRLFTCGTWSDYKRNAGNLPVLLPDQVRKLKQLSVLTLAEMEKELSYDQLMEELDVSNVRELEDFLIEFMYTGIIRGKLVQSRKCFEVQFAAGRDLGPNRLDNLIQTLNNWLSTSDDLLHLIQEKIKWADLASEENKKHKKEIKDKVERVKKSIKAELDFRGGHQEGFFELSRTVDSEEARRVRHKRRRHQMPEFNPLFGDQLPFIS